jgi:hypothetical protein
MAADTHLDETARLRGLMSALQRSIADADAPERIAGDARGWLLEQGVCPADAGACAEAGEKRLLVYRRLVRRGLSDAIRMQIPRTGARLGSAWDDYLSGYLHEQLPRSHYLRDVAFEFVDWALPRWALDAAVPAFLGDLARHELCAFEVAMSRDERTEVAPVPLSLDRPVRFDPSTRLKRYAWAIHRLNADEDARDTPPHEPTTLLAYRDADHEVRYLELTPRAAAVLDRLIAGQPLGQAVIDANEGPPAHPILEDIARLLDDLADRRVMLGAG